MKRNPATPDQKARKAVRRRLAHEANPEKRRLYTLKMKAEKPERDRLKKIEQEKLAIKEQKRIERNRRKARNFYLKNAEKVREKTAKYSRENPEKRSEYRANWRLRRYGQTEHYDALHAADKIRKLKAGLFGTCPYCKNEFPMKVLTIDHILPLSKGGIHIASNLTLACRSCNSSKSNRLTGEHLGNTKF